MADVVEKKIKNGLKDYVSSMKSKKRLRQRLRKSLLDQVLKMQQKLNNFEVEEKLTQQLYLKYSTKHGQKDAASNLSNEEIFLLDQQSKVAQKSYIYHEDLDLYLTDSDASKFGASDDECQLSEGKPKEKSGTRCCECKCQEIDTGDAKSILHQKHESILNSMTFKRASVLDVLYEKNLFLSNRSKELTRLKIAPYIGARALSIADSANFSTVTGNIDQILLEEDIPICDSLPQTPVDSFVIAKTSRHFVRKLALPNGELVVLKYHLKESPLLYREKCLQVLNEAKLIRMIQEHENVVHCFGITRVQNLIALVMSYESSPDLAFVLKKKRNLDETVIENLAIGLAKGLTHIHECGVLHNYIVAENICLKLGSNHFFPVIVGFSYSCRVSSAKCFTLQQQEVFEETHHLPRKVKSGIVPPNESSDIYSLGLLFARICAKLERGVKSKSLGNLSSLMISQNKNLIQNFWSTFKSLYKFQ